MKKSDIITIMRFLIFFLVGIAIGMKIDENHNKHIKELQNEIIGEQSETIDSLKTALKISNEKRGRLFMALLYTDIKGKEAALDSLIVEIGKDN